MGAYSAFAKPPFAVNLGRKQMLGPDILLVHGNALSRYELGMIRDYGAAISSAPEVEVQMGMGRPIIGAALRAGATIGLGVDVVSNIGGDMFHPMRSALVEERGVLTDALARNDQVPRRLEFTCKDVVRLATQGGAECIGLGSRIGSLTPGKQADVVCIRRDALHTMAAREPNSALVHYATPADVDSVWVGGKAVKRRGRLIDVDVSSVVARVCAARDGLDRKMAGVNIRALQAKTGFRNYGN
jgi:5-methylthioadenosine/S-adenosylhomocysteine deaminase